MSSHSGFFKVLLLTGPPGVGKTTVIRRVAAGLADRTLRGFTTEEIRERGQRVGFRLETFDGASAVLAHVDIRSPDRVGRYGVDVSALDRVVDSTLESGTGAEVTLVDEIGKMECLSPRFVGALERLLEAGVPLIATVAQKGGGLIERVKRRKNAELWEITRENRDAAPGRVLGWLAARRDQVR